MEKQARKAQHDMTQLGAKLPDLKIEVVLAVVAAVVGQKVCSELVLPEHTHLRRHQQTRTSYLQLSCNFQHLRLSPLSVESLWSASAASEVS